MKCSGCPHEAHEGAPYCGVDLDPGGGDVMQCGCRVGTSIHLRSETVSKKPTKTRPLTAERLGTILHEEFERDSWGDINPFYFHPENCAGDDEKEMHPTAVLKRVAARINKELGT